MILKSFKIDVINLPVHTFSMDKTKYVNVIWKKYVISYMKIKGCFSHELS